MRHCFCGDLPASFIISLSSGIIHMASHSSELHEDHCHELKSCQSLQPCTPGRSEAHPLAATGALLRKPLQTWRLGCAVSILASPSRKRLLSSHQTSPVMSEQDCCIRTACCPALRTRQNEPKLSVIQWDLTWGPRKASLLCTVFSLVEICCYRLAREDCTSCLLLQAPASRPAS